jgi:hypothetical protein
MEEGDQKTVDCHFSGKLVCRKLDLDPLMLAFRFCTAKERYGRNVIVLLMYIAEVGRSTHQICR